ncbi:O-antigen ligase family protein [Nocardioides sp. SYSU DS0651]|uniref:O-antigen ligase family protein n=1 Tax=Nocardioides sp. SYSU DS0651 TaxID=3415955 RepID=UPI003F4B14E4
MAAVAAMPEETSRIALHRPLVVLLFVLLLAGSLSFEDLGLANPLIIPERLAATLLVTLAVIVLAAANPPLRPPVAGAICIQLPLLYMLATGLWGAALPETWNAIIDLCCMALITAATILLMRLDPRGTARTLLWCAAVAGAIYAVAALAGSAVGERAMAFGSGPNVFSRMTLIGAIALVGLVVLERAPAALLVAVPILLAATVASGSRGAMLAGVIASVVLLPVLRRATRGQVVWALGSLAVGTTLVLLRYGDVVRSTIENRLLDLTFEQGYSSGRESLFSEALMLFASHPVTGVGLQGFQEQTQGPHPYPHNLVLQIAAEGGAVGLIFLTIGLVAAVGILEGRWHDPMTVLFASCAVVVLTSAMVSGSYYDSRFLWVFLAVALHAASARRVPAHEHRETLAGS